MKSLFLWVACFGSAATLSAQQPLSREEALKQLYRAYDPATETATWVCTKGQQQVQHEGWPCYKEYATVSVSVELSAQVEEDVAKTYVVTSAAPASAPNGYKCHACTPQSVRQCSRGDNRDGN